MANLHTSEAATGAGDRSRPRAALPALCATQITSWGIVYYAFPVLNPQINKDTGWPVGATTAAFSAALLVSAFTGIRVGRIIDRRGPRAVMTAGSVLGVLSILIVAAAPNLAIFTAGWLLAGMSLAATFYRPAFAALTRWWAPDHIRALTVSLWPAASPPPSSRPSPRPSPTTCPGARRMPSWPWSSLP